MNSIKKAVSSGITICSFALFGVAFNPAIAATFEDTQQYQTAEFALSEAELAQVLAPIALYPDSLLSHIMIASTYPLELVEAYRWQQDNSHLAPADAVEKAEQEGWDPSVTALVAFANVLERLNDDLRWTQTLGDAFLADESLVLSTIQTLRLEAEKANSLNNIPHMRVVKQQQQIIIEPVQHNIVYVPYYDTRVVYGNWRWHRYPPVHWAHRPYASVHFPVNVSARFHWGAGININFNYFFSAFSWHKRHLVVTHHRQARQYRSHYRIATSRGAKRWQHNVQHRRGVAYKTHQYARHTQHSSREKYANYAKTYDTRRTNKHSRKHVQANENRSHKQLQQRIKTNHNNRVQPKHQSRDKQQQVRQSLQRPAYMGERLRSGQQQQERASLAQKSGGKRQDLVRLKQAKTARAQVKRNHTKQQRVRTKVRTTERKRN